MKNTKNLWKSLSTGKKAVLRCPECNCADFCHTTLSASQFDGSKKDINVWLTDAELDYERRYARVGDPDETSATLGAICRNCDEIVEISVSITEGVPYLSAKRSGRLGAPDTDPSTLF